MNYCIMGKARFQAICGQFSIRRIVTPNGRTGGCHNIINLRIKNHGGLLSCGQLGVFNTKIIFLWCNCVFHSYRPSVIICNDVAFFQTHFDIFFDFVYLKLLPSSVKIYLWLILFVPNVKHP